MSCGTPCKELHAPGAWRGLRTKQAAPPAVQIVALSWIARSRCKTRPTRVTSIRPLANRPPASQATARSRRKVEARIRCKKRPALDGPPYQPAATLRAIDENLALNRLVENPVKFPIKLGDVLDLELIRKPAASHHV